MRRVVIGLGVLVLGLAVGAEAVAQSRVVVPIIIRPPAASSGATETRVSGPGASTTPATTGRASSFATSPSSTQEIRVLRPGTPATGGGSAGSGGTGYFTAPQTTQEIRIQTPSGGAAVDPGPARSYHTSPTRSQEIRIQGGGEVTTPVVIVPE